MALLQGALERQKRRALHEKQGERRKPKIRHRNVAATSLPGVRKGRAHRPQTSQKGWQKLHPNGESHSPPIRESPKCAAGLLLELLKGVIMREMAPKRDRGRPALTLV